MSIPYHVIEKGQPGVAGGGTRKFYAQTISTGEVNIEEITHRVA
tara:strand:+ start:805 stop:936 length:132 start_codon:yes stop_codon:yes gene_type:complete